MDTVVDNPVILVVKVLVTVEVVSVGLIVGVVVEFADSVCMETGYSGRAGIHEVLMVTDAVRVELMKGSDATTIKKLAVSHGMKTMREDAAMKVVQGLTTISEVLRVTQEESE